MTGCCCWRSSTPSRRPLFDLGALFDVTFALWATVTLLPANFTALHARLIDALAAWLRSFAASQGWL